MQELFKVKKMNLQTNRSWELYKKKAFPIGYAKTTCEEIKKTLEKTTIPLLTDEDTKTIRKKLEQSKKQFNITEKKELEDKFVESLEAISFLYAITQNDSLKKIIEYSAHYNKIIEKIIEKKQGITTDNVLIQQAMNILKIEIEKFIAQIVYLIEGDADSSGFKSSKELTNKKHD